MKTKDCYLEENFTPLVASSFTLREVAKKLGLHKSGGGCITINKYISLYNIDTSHFKFVREGVANKLPLERILVKDSAYNSTNHLKNRLYNEGLKQPVCEKCGQDEWWNGERMSLILDHINGDNRDNRLENLRIVCPNCEGTLETHCRGNKIKITPAYMFSGKEKIKCLNCGGEIYRSGKNQLCGKCYKHTLRKVERPSVHLLVEKVNTNGYKATGREYGVSDNTIRKWIKHEQKN